MIYDCFLFFDELELLELRLHELNTVVDKFILVEGDRTFSGKPKPLWFLENKGYFAQFSEKMVHATITGQEWPDGHDPWTREWHQRNHAACYLTHCVDEDIIMVSDVDEIPRASAVQSFKSSDGYRKCEQKDHYYYFNTVKGVMLGTALLSYGELKKIGSITGARQRSVGEEQIIRNAGWNFSYLGGPARIRRKIESFSHTELDQERFKNEDILQSRIENHEDIYQRHGHEYRTMVIDESYPSYLRSNADRFCHLIRSDSHKNKSGFMESISS